MPRSDDLMPQAYARTVTATPETAPNSGTATFGMARRSRPLAVAGERQRASNPHLGLRMATIDGVLLP
jgi:hypothetical protein